MFPSSFNKLIKALQLLPSVGEKSANRLAYFLIQEEEGIAKSLATAIVQAKEKIRLCEKCCGFTENHLCAVCSDPLRQKDLVCVVEKPADVKAIEAIGEYKGVYHILHGLWRPLQGVQIGDLTVPKLIKRVDGGEVKELLLALSFTTEGEATCAYLMNLFKGREDLLVTRLAQGVPQGGQLEYVDSLTLKHAFLTRKRF